MNKTIKAISLVKKLITNKGSKSINFRFKSHSTFFYQIPDYLKFVLKIPYQYDNHNIFKAHLLPKPTQ